MSFVSFAQNYEDVMLFRALRGIEHGFYIDVGAQDPVEDSVTKAFYEKGWRGINIEPVAHWFQRLVAYRPHDINLQVAVSDGPGKLHLFEVVDSGLSTTDPDFAKQHAQAGYQICESDVDCLTLDEICKSYPVEEIHFLKIDCEGGEAAALRGLSLERIRPWIILLEATAPNSQQPVYMEWEPLLTGCGYHFVYEDGLNRFYVADEHSELDSAFSHPPNVFDYFVRAAEAVARHDLQIAQGDLSALRDAQRVARIESECEQLLASTEYFHSENERREAALVEYRRLLGEAEEREAQGVARLQVENERRESVLAEHRRLLDEAAEREAQSMARMQTERDQWQTDIEYLRSENEGREAALVEHRQLLIEAAERLAQSLAREQAHSEHWRNHVEHLRTENDRKEQVMVEQHQAIVALESMLAVSRRDLAAASEHTMSLSGRLASRDHDLALLRAVIDGSAAQVSLLESETGRLNREVAVRDQEVDRLHGLIQTIHHSTSWRITAPMRWLVSGPSHAAISAIGKMRLKIKKIIKKALTGTAIHVTRRPQLKRLIVIILSPFPTFKERLKRVVTGADSSRPIHSSLATELADLTPHARRVYADLEAAVDKNNRDK